jgi:hypothetical protein
MNTPRPAPGRIALHLATRATARHAWRDDVLGDLLEEYADLAATRGESHARRWFRRQAIRLAADACAARMRAVLQSLAVLFFIGDRPMTALLQEVRQAFRSLLRRPGVTVAIMLTLAIGLGVNAAIFNAIDRLLLSPFPFPGVERILVLSELNDENPYPKESVSPANFIDIGRSTTSFDRFAAYGWSEANLSGGTQPERVSAFTVSAEFFNTLGVTPAQGRLLDARDMTFGAHHVVVLE